MTILWAGLLIFFGAHIIPVRADLKEKLVSNLGLMGYQAFFSIASLVGLALIIYGYGLARATPQPFDPIYFTPEFMRHLTMLLMLPVFILVFASYFKGRIKAKVKHPTFIAIKIWALAHLLVNGRLADILLFGSFLVWAVLAMIAAKSREGTQPELSDGSLRNDIVSVVLGLGLYIVFSLWLHQILIGVAPIPA